MGLETLHLNLRLSSHLTSRLPPPLWYPVAGVVGFTLTYRELLSHPLLLFLDEPTSVSQIVMDE